ncbi:MAG: hypothetical protein V2I97_22760, partial [Desulfococcaceae bacterium]|nr:hypothetical protein [Desulfococcaceae bacterium]
MSAVSEQTGSVGIHENRALFIRLNTFKIEYLFGILLFPAVCSPYILLVYEFVSKGLFLNKLPEIINFRTLKLLGSSLLLSVLVSLTSFFLAIICLALLWKIRTGYIRKAILTGAALLFSLSPVIHIIGWQSVPFLAKLPPLFSSVMILSWNAFPVFLMLLLAGLFSMDQSALESAMLICNRKKIIRHFIIPHLFPVSLAAAVITGVMSFIQMEVPGLTGYAVYPE